MKNRYMALRPPPLLAGVAGVVTFAVLFAGSVRAQVPDTPAGRQASAWIAAINSGDKDAMQQFVEKSMPVGRPVEQNVAQGTLIRYQSGGFDVKKVEESSDTRVVLLLQERGPA